MGIVGSEKEVPVSKVVEEFPLPACSQTHEMTKVGEEMLLLSQQPTSCVVKVKLQAGSGQPLEAKKFRLGGNACAGLHGLYASVKQEGRVWATLQFESALLLLNPAPADVHEPPHVVKRIDLEPEGTRWGPHTLVEDPFTSDLWVACKGSSYVLRVNPSEPSDYTAYPCSRRPIFVAVHPTSGDIYSSLDLSSKIFRLARSSNPATADPSTFPPPTEIDIPASVGNTPVGLIAAPDGNVWFVLLGDSTGGTGTFGRISSNGSITWFRLPSAPGSSAGLIHLAFDPDYVVNSKKNNTDTIMFGKPPLRVWLLGSTMASSNSVNAIFSVCIDGDDPNRIASVDTVVLPTPSCMTHRVLLHGGSRLFVTELGVSLLARVTGGALWGKVTSETSDPYALWGCGSDADYIRYVAPASTSEDQDQDTNVVSYTPANKKRRTVGVVSN